MRTLKVHSPAKQSYLTQILPVNLVNHIQLQVVFKQDKTTGSYKYQASNNFNEIFPDTPGIRAPIKI